MGRLIVRDRQALVQKATESWQRRLAERKGTKAAAEAATRDVVEDLERKFLAEFRPDAPDVPPTAVAPRAVTEEVLSVEGVATKIARGTELTTAEAQFRVNNAQAVEQAIATRPVPPEQAVTPTTGAEVVPRISEQEEFKGAADLILREPNTPSTEFIYGKEKSLGTVEDFHTFVTPKGAFEGRVNNFVLNKWQKEDGTIRYLVHGVQENGEPFSTVSSAVQFKLENGVPKILTVASSDKRLGLATKLLKQLEIDFGTFTFEEPISQQGASLLRSMGKLPQPTVEAVVTEAAKAPLTEAEYIKVELAKYRKLSKDVGFPLDVKGQTEILREKYRGLDVASRLKATGLTQEEINKMSPQQVRDALVTPPVVVGAPLTEALITDAERIVTQAEAVQPTNPQVQEMRRLVDQAKTLTGEPLRQALIKIEALEDEVRAIAPVTEGVTKTFPPVVVSHINDSITTKTGLAARIATFTDETYASLIKLSKDELSAKWDEVFPPNRAIAISSVSEAQRQAVGEKPAPIVPFEAVTPQPTVEAPVTPPAQVEVFEGSQRQVGAFEVMTDKDGRTIFCG